MRYNFKLSPDSDLVSGSLSALKLYLHIAGEVMDTPLKSADMIKKEQSQQLEKNLNIIKSRFQKGLSYILREIE